MPAPYGWAREGGSTPVGRRSQARSAHLDRGAQRGGTRRGRRARRPGGGGAAPGARVPGPRQHHRRTPAVHDHLMGGSGERAVAAPASAAPAGGPAGIPARRSGLVGDDVGVGSLARRGNPQPLPSVRGDGSSRRPGPGVPLRPGAADHRPVPVSGGGETRTPLSRDSHSPTARCGDGRIWPPTCAISRFNQCELRRVQEGWFQAGCGPAVAPPWPGYPSSRRSASHWRTSPQRQRRRPLGSRVAGGPSPSRIQRSTVRELTPSAPASSLRLSSLFSSTGAHSGEASRCLASICNAQAKICES
jgi:hypothetical protein